jgi:hypothetical protein
MKIQKFILAIAIAVMFITVNIFAQTDISVIQSPDLARDLGLRLSKRGSIYYSSPSIDWSYPGTQTTQDVVGQYAEDVLAQLAAFQYNFRLKNPMDDITAYVYIKDDNGIIIFYGQAIFKAGEKPQIQMWQQWVPILNNVKSAEIIPLKEDDTSGQPIRVEVSEQGQLLWQPWISGAKNGILIVESMDGTFTSYRISSPIAQSLNPADGNSGTLNIKDHYMFGKGSTVDIIAVWNRPTAYFEIDNMDRYASFCVRGILQLQDGNTALEWPSSAIVTDEDGNNPQTIKLLEGGITRIWMNSGKYRVRSFEWKNFAQPGNLYTGPQE